MVQYDVHLNRDPRSAIQIPFLLDVQSDLLETLATRVVVPLVDAAHFGPPAQRLNPVFQVEGRAVVLSVAELAGVPKVVLGERVASLADRRAEVTAALDLLLLGI
ncbi:MAG: CcdB family protein [Candidatus Nanopelagicales bacterium]|jgi:toxin CcdB|nr:CcdB family protein [Candidatus Nanopelagicales bacterium]